MLRAIGLLGQCEYEYTRYHLDLLIELSLHQSPQPQPESESDEEGSSVTSSISTSSSSSSRVSPISTCGDIGESKAIHNKSPYFSNADNMITRSQRHSPTGSQRMITPPTTPINSTRSIKRKGKGKGTCVAGRKDNEDGFRPPTPESIPSKKRKRVQKEVRVEIPSRVEVEVELKTSKRKKKKKKKEKDETDLKGTAKIDNVKNTAEEVVVESERGVVEHIGKIHLIQEKLRYNPWKMLIATSLLNKTSGRAVKPILEELLERYRTPQSLAEASIPDLAQLLYPLGLYNQRASSLVRFSRQYLDLGWPLFPITSTPIYTEDIPPLNKSNTKIGRDTNLIDNSDLDLDVKVFHGSGLYASDSFRIFSQFHSGQGAPSQEFKWLGKVERAKERMRNEGGWNGSVDMLSDYLSDDDDDEPKGEEGEWRKVVPLDKELRRYLIWRWGIEGIVYDIHTGPRIVKQTDKRRLKYLLEENDTEDTTE
ncbi:hypothetical protein V866_001010 [Kwoniella sp. B9012]|uniref:HhH-GPD domain-containing protein n=1 Tax=Kwoniella europaea PYCC6329 TaxID=1423913 RepID=A0AAX4K915_9TREE